jgi:hypothetical protein
MGKGIRNMKKVFATWEKVFATLKSVRSTRKVVRNIRNTFRNIMIRRLICFLIRIVWLRRCPILLAVPMSYWEAPFRYLGISKHHTRIPDNDSKIIEGRFERKMQDALQCRKAKTFG